MLKNKIIIVLHSGKPFSSIYNLSVTGPYLAICLLYLIACKKNNFLALKNKTFCRSL